MTVGRAGTWCTFAESPFLAGSSRSGYHGVPYHDGEGFAEIAVRAEADPHTPRQLTGNNKTTCLVWQAGRPGCLIVGAREEVGAG